MVNCKINIISLFLNEGSIHLICSRRSYFPQRLFLCWGFSILVMLLQLAIANTVACVHDNWIFVGRVVRFSFGCTVQIQSLILLLKYRFGCRGDYIEAGM